MRTQSHSSKVRNDVITINMCTHDSEHGWPPPDDGVCNFFQQMHNTFNHPETHYAFTTFLHALAVKVVKKLDELEEDQESLAKAWQKFIEPVLLQERQNTIQSFFGSR